MKILISSSLLVLSFFANATSDKQELYEYCEDIPLNQPMKVVIPSFRSKTLFQKYTLLRTEENVYDIFLNLEFYPGKTYELEYESKEQFNKDQRILTTACFEQMEDKLFDERGRFIRLHLYDKEKTPLPSPPPLVKISMENSDHRSHSDSYSSTINCPLRIHEALHLLGLVDEYKEKQKSLNHNLFSLAFKPYLSVSEKNPPAFDCRAVGPKNSIMNQHMSIYWGRSLYSGHVNAIIYPNCKVRNEKYYNCAKFAYQTSFENNGAVLDLVNCQDRVPDYCKDVDWVKTDK